MGTEFGENIEKALKQKKMTQKKLSEESGVTEASISHYIKGDREPRSRTVEILAGILGVSASFLLGYGTGKKVSDGKKENFEEIKRLIQENKDSFSAEEKMEIIKILSV